VNESGWTVEEEGGTVAIRARHIAILFRRFRQFRTDVTRAWHRRGGKRGRLFSLEGGTRGSARPILRRAAAAAGKGGLRRETPVLLRRDDGSLVEGTVDLAFYEDTSDFAGWTVVDFKTDREIETISVYTAQVRVYMEAISAATGSAARGIILML
jgi:hypothetical protein